MNASPNEFLVRTPQDPPPPHLKPTFWSFWGSGGGGGGWGGSKMTPPFFWVEIMNLLVFSILSRKSVSGSGLHGVCIRRSGTSADVVYALFSHFCYVGGFGDHGDPVVPSLRGVSGDVVTVYAY